MIVRAGGVGAHSVPVGATAFRIVQPPSVNHTEIFIRKNDPATEGISRWRGSLD